MNEQQTILTMNMILEKLRKHLTLYSFHEQRGPCVQMLATQLPTHTKKIFVIDSIITPQLCKATLAILPSKTIYSDAMLIKILDTFFNETLLLDMYTLKLNFLGCRNDQEVYNKKITKSTKNIQRLDFLCALCQQEWQLLLDTLRILSISFIIDQSLIITANTTIKTQFEFLSRTAEKTNSLATGCHIIIDPTGEDAAHAQVNIDTIVNIDHKLILPTTPTLHMIVPLQQTQNNLALLIATMLHRVGKCVDVLLTASTTQERLMHAHQTHAKYLLLLGDEEQQTGTITIKNLMTGTQETVKQTHLTEHLS